jgi:hypothetical protein
MSPNTLLLEITSLWDNNSGGERHLIPTHSIDYMWEKKIGNHSYTVLVLKTGKTVTSTTPYDTFLSEIIEADDAS